MSPYRLVRVARLLVHQVTYQLVVADLGGLEHLPRDVRHGETNPVHRRGPSPPAHSRKLRRVLCGCMDHMVAKQTPTPSQVRFEC